LVLVHGRCWHRHNLLLLLLLLLLKILMLVLLWLEILLCLVVVLLLLLLLLLLGHQCQLHIRWWCEAAGHGKRVIDIGFERVSCAKATSVGHAGDLLPPRFILVEAVE
jgi:hypothetical protein